MDITIKGYDTSCLRQIDSTSQDGNHLKGISWVYHFSTHTRCSCWIFSRDVIFGSKISFFIFHFSESLRQYFLLAHSHTTLYGHIILLEGAVVNISTYFE